MSPVNRPPRGYNTETNTSRVYDNTIYIGLVKRNDDAQRMGRLSVWIPEICGDPKNESSWLVVNYLSPFAGSTSIDDVKKGNTTMSGSQTSYGMWMVPPDLDNQVAVFFANGDTARGFWFGCALQQNMNHMLPGVASNVATDPSYKTKGIIPPVVEYNKSSSANVNSPARPAFTPMADGLSSQGLTKDSERGPSSSSARREAPSKVFGFNTPRSSSIYIDDNPDNEFIRLRTRSGAQILIHETTGYVYINSKNGSSWMELSDAGIDVYTDKSISMRSMADFNVRAEGNIIFDAGVSILMQAAQDIILQGAKTVQIGSGTDIILTAVGGKLEVQTSTDILVKAGAGLQLQAAGGNLTAKASAAINLQAGGALTEKAGGAIIRSAGGGIQDNSGSVADTSDISPDTVKGPKPTTQLDVLNGKSATTDSIVSRMPSHEPWRGHPKANLPPARGPATLGEMAANQGQGSGPTTNQPDTSTVQTGTGPVTLVNNDGMTCATGVGTKNCSNDQFNAIKTASSAKGIPFGNMMAMGDVESSFSSSAVSSTNCQGTFQFCNGTWNSMIARYGAQDNVPIGTTRSDTNANALMAANYYNENQALLQAKGISNPTCGQIYMCHMLGGGGGPKMIAGYQQNPNMTIAEAEQAGYLDGSQVANNPGWFKGCNTIGDAYNKIDGTMNTKASLYNQQAGLPAPCDRSGSSGSTTTSNVGASATGTASPSTSNAGLLGSA